MSRFDSHAVGRWSLRIDTAYCALLGIAVVLTAGVIAEGIALHPLAITAAGVIVVVWAGAIAWMLRLMRLRRALWVVMTVNIVAGIAVALASGLAATPLIAFAVLAIAIDVLLFAASQAVALRGLRPGTVS